MDRDKQIIRIKVIQTKWAGTAGFGRCEGTSKEQAAKNCALREEMLNSEEIFSQMKRYTLEDGYVIELTRNMASDYV